MITPLTAFLLVIVVGCSAAVAVRNMDALYAPEAVRDRLAGPGVSAI